MSSRFVSVVGFVVLSLGSVACYMQPADGHESGSGNAKSGGGSATKSEDGATCDSACKNVLACQGIEDSSQNRAQCVKNCTSMKIGASDLQTLSEGDCETVNALVNPPKQEQQGTGGSKGSECDGCVRDGNECIWLSQSNWGPGAYSGAASSCEAYCCQ
jgi:hypothetical protein